MSHKFPYKWNLAEGYPTEGIKYHGTTVMTTFACGGGSTMGYKLAGYDVVAANDIDPQMAKVYKANHSPKQFFLCGIKELLDRDDLPQVDVLDGSPPCSLFSTAGVREEGWQKEKMFREGQAKQVLDDLFFDFIDLAEKMQPKIVVAENVKGMIIGNAKWYTREVVRRFNKIGYTCQVFLFNAATMGVPQRRERVFFIAHKTNNKMLMTFNEPTIEYGKIFVDTNTKSVNAFNKELLEKSTLKETSLSHVKKRLGLKESDFNAVILDKHKVLPTIASASRMFNRKEITFISKESLQMGGSFPMDYKFMDVSPQYLIGMSVPPVMMANVAYEVYNQLIK